MRNFSITSLFLIFSAISSFTQALYSNGPVNGTTDAWTINSGFVVSDTFNLAAGGGTIVGFNFYAWMFPGDVLQNAEISITSSEFGVTAYFDGVVNFTQSACSTNQIGFNVCLEASSDFSGPTLGAGTYWLNLQNATVNDGDPIYWDENSGPSSASENSVGTIPSEAFTVLGACEANKTSPDCGPPVPEPGSIWMWLTGAASIAGIWLRRLLD